ncbi:hypothetical protein RB195_011195 [Necator americanus]|uniref:Uncharacterized protein n=1 Tax=Necator americanus TaxID=51031 RepID=A0ABR1D2P3_NECAM
MQVDSGDGLPVSALPGSAFNTTVCRTSLRPKAGNQVTERLPKRKRTRVTIYLRNYNARTLASDAAIEDVMMQARKFKYDVIELTETRRRHPLNAVCDTGEEVFLGTCHSRGVGGVAVFIDANMAVNINSFEKLTTRIGLYG